MSEHKHEWIVYAVFGGPDVEAVCDVCGKTLSAADIDARLETYDGLLEACKKVRRIFEQLPEDWDEGAEEFCIDTLDAAIQGSGGAAREE
jgi:hypothetical protein